MRSMVFLICAVSLAWLPAATARAGTRVGPHLTVAEEFTDNLLLSASDEASDWITTVEPGIGLVYGSSALVFESDYSLRFRYYQEHSEASETSFRDVQRATASALLFPARNFNIAADGEISRVALDERGPGVEESELVNTTNLYRYAVNPRYVRQWSSAFASTLGYRYGQTDYESAAGDDTSSHEYSLLLERTHSRRTDLRFRYAYLEQTVTLFRDFEQHTALAGVTHRYGPRTDLSADIGSVKISFADGSEKELPVWNGRVAYRFSGFLSLALTSFREFTVSVRRGFTKGDTASASLVYAGRATAEGRVYLTEREYLEEQSKDEVLGARMLLTVPLEDRYYTTVFVDYRYLHFLPDDEKADRSALGATIGYAFKPLDVSLGYTYILNDSNIDGNDYRNNLVLLKGSLRY